MIFAEITSDNGKRTYINVTYIESIQEINENQTIIYMLPNEINGYKRDYYEVDMPYDEVVAMLEGGAE